MTKYQRLSTAIGIMNCAGVLLAASSSRATIYEVNVNTMSLVGNANAPYYVDFQLNYGSGPTGNSAAIYNFNFGGGSASPAGSAIVYIGTTAGGDLSTALTLTDNPSSPFNEIAQQFTPGQTLSFDVNLTANGTGLTPDGFVFGIDDQSTFQIPTTSPDGITLAMFNISPFLSNPAISVATYSGLGDYSGVTVTVTPTPEPSIPLLVLLGLGLVVAARYRRAGTVSKAV